VRILKRAPTDVSSAGRDDFTTNRVTGVAMRLPSYHSSWPDSGCSNFNGAPKMSTWHKRTALNLAAQLPEDPEDVRLILEKVRQIVEDFFTDQPSNASKDGQIEAAREGGNVVPFGRV
jgi:hypothetical protein